MHYIDTSAKCSVTAMIRADGAPCDEYHIPSEDVGQRCWVSLETGQTLSIDCIIEMTALYCQVDLIIDGVLRNTFLSKSIEDTQKRTESITFTEGTYKKGRTFFQSHLRVCDLNSSRCRLRFSFIALYLITC